MGKKFETREICRQILDAESEAAVQKIIETVPEMREPRNWRPLDGRETNFNVTSNQASDGGKALTELMTNMVDAVLTKHALKEGIDPKGKAAPQTMHEAVDILIKKLRGGKLTNLDPNDPWLRSFSQSNLVIGVTGAKSKRSGLPCYTFVDNGEGQYPEKFESTFLSLSTGNKKDIPFVQGKYNMGSSGVLGYCGRKWFKLIVSRRYDVKKPWGFTLMRKRPGGGMPVAEYLVLPDGGIPSFDEDALYPFVKGDGKRYDGVHLATGTVIKLYDYQIGSRFSSGFRGSREALNENLVETILPFRILDFRWPSDPKRGGDRAEGIDSRGFCGMEFLLLRSHRENDIDEEEEGEGEGEGDEGEAAGDRSIAVATIKTEELGEISISAIKLKRELPGWLKYSNNRVFHAVNGQVQFKQTRGYLSQSCGLPALKNRVVVIVDASGLTFEAHNEVWKGDREHVRDTIVGERYKETVTAAIKESKALKALQEQVAKEELEQAAKTQSNDLFQKLVNADPNLAVLLADRDPVIKLPSAGAGEKGPGAGEGQFEGKYHPTYLRFDENFKKNGLSVPINRTRLAIARTDAENGYMQRADNKGAMLIAPSPYKHFGLRAHLHDGRLMIYLEPVADALKIGDSFELKFGLKDDSMAEAVEDWLKVRIVEEESKPVKPKTGKGAKSGDKDGKNQGEGPPAPTHGLPPYRLLTKDGRQVGTQPTLPWPDDFSELDGGLIEDLGEQGVMYKINYDNSYHIKYRLGARGDVARDVMTEKFVLGMRILMLGYEHALRALKQAKGASDNGIAEFQDDFRRISARGAAATVLALAENLPKIIDKSSVTATQDVE